MTRPKDLQAIFEAAQRIVDLRAKADERTQGLADMAAEARRTGKGWSRQWSELPPVVDFGDAIDALCEAMNGLTVASDNLLSDGDSEKRRADQNAMNSGFLREKIDQIHAVLCPGERGTWQERSEQAVAAAKRLRDASNEVTVWKQIAAALGEYHAANLHDAELKSVSQSRKARYRSIMVKSADMLSGNAPPPKFCSSPTVAEEKLQQTVGRLRDHASKLPEPGGK